MSKSKDASSRLHEKHQNILADLLRDEDNKYCADCMAKGPRWASWNLGVFMCIRCAGIHRNLGVHISRVKSVNLDSWTPEQIESIQKGGNGHAKRLYEANLPANFRRPQDDYAVEQFIRAKYERKQYISKGGSSEPVAKESQEQKAKNKQKKASSSSITQKSSREQVLSVPRPSGVKRSPSPQLPKPTSSLTSSSSSSKPNLIAIDPGTSTTTATTATAKASSPQPQIDILTGLSPAPSAANNAPSSSSSQGASLLMDTKAVGATSSPAGNQPLFGSSSVQPQPAFGVGLQPQQTQGAQVSTSTKDSIMSLYSAQNQPQLSSYTAQGYPVNSFYYRQQQEAAMRMAHMAAIQQHQVNQVTAQIQQIKVNQQQHQVPTMPPASQPFPSGISNGGVGAGGQTLNPTLW